jgi:serine/threonine protein kinase/WD40 repeat protein
VAVHTAFEANSTAYMVMELLHGSHLAQLLDKRGGRLPEIEAVPLIERVGEALQWVHDKGLLHRDIKPENIIATDDGRVMLIDFGTAREYAQGQAQGHTIVVTPGYAPLEQYAKQAKRGAFTDVYGLAATLYHLLTGQAPPAASDRAVGVQLRPVREQNPQISPSVARAVEAGLEMEIAKRPQSVREFLELMRAPQAVEAADFAVGLAPPQNPTADPEWDALLVRASAPPHLFPGALQARQHMLNELFPDPQSSVQPVQLAPIVTPPPSLPILPTTTTAVKAPTAPSSHSFSNLPSAMSSHTGGGYLNQPTHDYDAEVSKFALWAFGGIAAFVGLMFAIASGSRSTPSPTHWSPSGGYSSPDYYPSYRRSSPVYVPPARTRVTPQEAARRDMESTPAILPVSVETLPISPKAATNQAKTSADTALANPYISARGLARFSPGGQLVAYVDGDDVVRVWSLARRRVISSLPQDKKHPPRYIHFSPDAKHLVLTHRDKRGMSDKVTVWNLSAKRSLGTFSVDPAKEWLAAHAMRPDGKIIISKSKLGQNQQRYFEWDPRTGKQSATAMQASDSVRDQIFPADGQSIVTADGKGQIRWFDARTGAQKASQSTVLTYRDLQSSPLDASTSFQSSNLNAPLAVDSLRLSPNGSYLAAGNAMQIRVFDSKAREVSTLPVGYSPEFAVSPDGKWVVEGGGGKVAGHNLLWNLSSRRKVRLQAPAGQIKAWSFSADGKQVIGLLSSSEGVSLVTWPTGAKPVALFSSPQFKTSLPVSLPGPLTVSPSQRLLAMQTDQRLEIRRLDGSHLTSLDAGDLRLTEMNFSPDGRFLSGLGFQGETRLWNVQTGKEVAQLENLKPSLNKPTPLQFQGYAAKSQIFSPDNRLFARAGSVQGQNRVELWSLEKSARRLASFSQSQPITALRFSLDNRALICSEEGGKLLLYDVATRKLRAETQNGSALIAHLAPTKQGLAVLSKAKTGALVTWYKMPSSGDATRSTADPKQGFQKQNQVTIVGFRARPNSVAISPDGQLVAASSYFNFSARSGFSGSPQLGIGIWHLSTGSLMQPLPLHSRGEEPFPPALSSMSVVDELAFSPDGTELHCIDRDMRPGGRQQAITWRVPSLQEPSP